MKKLILAIGVLLSFILVMESCKPAVVKLKTYADKIEAQLKVKPTPSGYAFVVSRFGEPPVERAGGFARLKQDLPVLPQSVSVRYNLASVSKMITVAAVLNLLSDKEIDPDEKIVGHLPWNWQPGPGIDTITFKELLQHRSGLVRGNPLVKCDDYGTYANLKTCITVGFDPKEKDKGCGDPVGDKGLGCYNNMNYALFRVIIPVLLGDIKKPAPTVSSQPTDHEYELIAANSYIKYVNENVLSKAGLPALSCRPEDGEKQGLSYTSLAPNGKGVDFGDFTLMCGGEGWFLSASQLATFFYTINNTNQIISATMAAQMRNEFLGYKFTGVIGAPAGKVQYWFEPGGYSAPPNNGQIGTLVLRFSNGVEVVMINTSDMTSTNNNIVVSAMSDLLNGK